MTTYSKFFPGLLHTPTKYEENPPYGCEAIAKRKCGSGGVASPIYKQASLVGRLKIAITHLWHAIEPQTICHLIVKDKVAERRENSLGQLIYKKSVAVVVLEKSA